MRHLPAPSLPAALLAALLVLLGAVAVRAPTPESALAPVQTPGPSPYARARVEALLERRLPCLGCHGLDGRGGRIGPDLGDVGSRLTAEGIAAMIDDPATLSPGSPMPRVPMPDRWRELLVAYLAARTGGAPAGASGVLPAARAPAARAGPALYGRYCAACHGPTGSGDGPNARFLPVPPVAHSDSAAMAARPDDSLFDAIHAGGYIMGRSPYMPAYGETLEADEIRALVAHIRSLCRCQGPAWSRDGAR